MSIKKQVWSGSYKGNVAQVHQVGVEQWHLASWDASEAAVHDALFNNKDQAIDVGHDWLWAIAEKDQEGWL